MADISKGTAFPSINVDKLWVGSTQVLSSTPFDRLTKVAVLSFTGATLHGGVQSWANPEGADIVVGPVLINMAGNTSSTGTMSVGVQSNSVVLSCTLIDNTSINTTTVLNNIDQKGTGGAFVRKVASGSYVTFAEASGNAATALNTANCLICYTVI